MPQHKNMQLARVQEASRLTPNIESDGSLSTLNYNVFKIKSHLERLKDEEPKIAKHYEKWLKQRQETIETIAFLQKKLNKICKGSNIVKCVGATAGLVGIVTGIAGVCLGNQPLATNLKLVSTCSSGAGAITCASSTLVEAGLSHRVIMKIKRVLKQDVKLTKSLKEWVHLSKEVDNLMKGLFQCNITSTTFINVFKMCQRCIKLLNTGKTDLEELMLPLEGSMLQADNLEGFEGLTLEDGQKVFNFLKLIKKSPGILTPLGDICNFFRENSNTFDFAKLGTILYSQIYALFKSESLELLPSVTDSVYPLLSSSLTMRCALDTIAIGSRVVSIILALKKIKKAKSKYSKVLDELHSALSLELIEVNRQMSVLLQT